MGPLLVLVITFGAMWLLFILPQQRRVRAHQAMLGRLEVGDEVISTAGLFGTIVAIDDEVVSLEVADGMVLRMLRRHVGNRLVEAEPAPTDAGELAAGAPTGTAADRAAALDSPPSDPPSSEP